MCWDRRAPRFDSSHTCTCIYCVCSVHSRVLFSHVVRLVVMFHVCVAPPHTSTSSLLGAALRLSFDSSLFFSSKA